MERIIKNMRESAECGLPLASILSNALTSALNTQYHHNISIDINEYEILVFIDDEIKVIPL